MSPALPEPAEHALAVLRRARARGERFVGALLPGASAQRMRAAAIVDEWAAANLEAHRGDGPLWVVLGDGASLGLGASRRTAGYVCLVADALRAVGPAWRVVNLARVSADLDDVLARQLPTLATLTATAPAALVTCLAGAADVLGRPWGAQTRLRSLLAALPAGAVVGTFPPMPTSTARRNRAAAVMNDVLRQEADRRGLRVVDTWDDSARRGRWFGADYHPNDVGHAAWAQAVLAAADTGPTGPAGAPRVGGAGPGESGPGESGPGGSGPAGSGAAE